MPSRRWPRWRKTTGSMCSGCWSKPGPDGMPAGEIAAALGLAPNTLTFHFDRLRGAGLVTVRREGRSMIYAARFETMNALLGYLTDNCCGGAPEKCLPAKICEPSKARREKRKLHHDSWSADAACEDGPELREIFARLREVGGGRSQKVKPPCCYALSRNSVLLRALEGS